MGRQATLWRACGAPESGQRTDDMDNESHNAVPFARRDAHLQSRSSALRLRTNKPNCRRGGAHGMLCYSTEAKHGGSRAYRGEVGDSIAQWIAGKCLSHQEYLA